MIDEARMRFEEKAVYQLRTLYGKYGYLPYKMSKFEEYELYIRNKDFLVSDRVIAFNDTNGKLMALKPDVTLSIIKNGEDVPGQKQKVFYNENVYCVSESTHRFKEIMQTGLECIGDIDLYDIYEVITLAAESLSGIAEDFYLEISNMDIVYQVITSVSDKETFLREVLRCISEKNSHDLKHLCEEYGTGSGGYEKISKLVSLYGDRREVLKELKTICDTPELEQLTTLSRMLDSSVFGDRIRFDFSVVNDMNYYNGFVFKGFVGGIYCGVLAGGQYDNMMKKMHRNSGAIGFALYLDRLEELNRQTESYDVDYLLLYDDSADVFELSAAVSRLIATGSTVSAQKSIPEKLRYRKVMDLRRQKETD